MLSSLLTDKFKSAKIKPVYMLNLELRVDLDENTQLTCVYSYKCFITLIFLEIYVNHKPKLEKEVVVKVHLIIIYSFPKYL